jgi:hypothetical protein
MQFTICFGDGHARLFSMRSVKQLLRLRSSFSAHNPISAKYCHCSPMPGHDYGIPGNIDSQPSAANRGDMIDHVILY